LAFQPLTLQNWPWAFQMSWDAEKEEFASSDADGWASEDAHSSNPFETYSLPGRVIEAAATDIGVGSHIRQPPAIYRRSPTATPIMLSLPMDDGS